MRIWPALFMALTISYNLPAQSESLETNTWAVRSFQDGKILIETFRKGSDGWQDLVERRQFLSETSAQRYLRQSRLRLATEGTPEGHELTSPALMKANNVLWTATSSWNLDWEDKFSQWISNEVDAQFFKKHNLATDCADVLYSLRWIFARIHHLEMASRLSGSGDFFTHRSLRSSWAQLPTAVNWYDDKRFRAALDYLLDNTYTHSLMADSYPVAIRPEAIRAGTFHLDLHRDSGHTQVVSRSMMDSPTVLPFIIIQSTVPRAVRVLSTAGFWAAKQPQLGEGGLLRMRWPVFKNGSPNLVKASQMPFFSEEQYGPDFLRSAGFLFNQEVYLRLNPHLNFKDVHKEATQSLQDAFLDRLRLVDDGYQVCRNKSCPPNSQLYDDWSTPSRDRRLADLFEQKDALESFLGATPEAERPFLPLDGDLYTLAALRRSWRFGFYSSDPNDPPEKRWGLNASSNLDALRTRAEVLVKNRELALTQGKSLGENTLQLLDWRSLVGSFCASAPPEQCSRFLAGIASTPLTSTQHAFSIEELLRRIPWMTFEVGNRFPWGERFSQSNAIDTMTLRSLQTVSTGWLLEERANFHWHLRFVDSGNLQEIAQIQSKTRLRLLPNFIWTWQNDRLQIWPLAHQQVLPPLEITLSQAPKTIQVTGNYIIPVQEDGSFSIGRWTEKQTGSELEWQWLYQGQELRLSNGEYPYLLESIIDSKGQNTLRVLDLSDPNLRRAGTGAPIPSYAVPNEDSGDVLSGNAQYIVFTNGLLEKKSGQWIPYSFEGCQFSNNGRYGLCLRNPNQTIELVDLLGPPGPKVLVHLSAIGYLNDNFLQTMNIDKPGWSYYRWNQDHLEALPVAADEGGISFASPFHYVAITKSGNSRIYQTGSNTPWMDIQGRVWGSRNGFERVGLFQAPDSDGQAISTYSLTTKQLVMRNPRPPDMMNINGPLVSGDLGLKGHQGLWWPPQR